MTATLLLLLADELPASCTSPSFRGPCSNLHWLQKPRCFYTSAWREITSPEAYEILFCVILGNICAKGSNPQAEVCPQECVERLLGAVMGPWLLPLQPPSLCCTSQRKSWLLGSHKQRSRSSPMKTVWATGGKILKRPTSAGQLRGQLFACYTNDRVETLHCTQPGHKAMPSPASWIWMFSTLLTGNNSLLPPSLPFLFSFFQGDFGWPAICVIDEHYELGPWQVPCRVTNTLHQDFCLQTLDFISHKPKCPINLNGSFSVFCVSPQ